MSKWTLTAIYKYIPIKSAYDNLYKSVKGLNKMYYTPWVYPYPYQHNVYCANVPMNNNYIRQTGYWNIYDDARNKVKDYGRKPFVVNINEAAKHNNTYRTA